MLFNSLDFALFFPSVFVLYWLFSKHVTARNIFLLLASYFFYACWDWRFLILIVLSSAVDFTVGLTIGKSSNKRKQKLLLLLSIITNLGLLFYFKYTNFFIESFSAAFSFFGNPIETSTLNIILPVGISFYTFQTLSYTIDVYRNKIKPTKNILAFFTFVSFFPQLVAGPIERATHLLPQFYKTHQFNYDRVKSGLLLMGFGLFKKMVIADRLAVLVNQVYNNPLDHSGYEVVLATVFFAFQIYCDFSGYSDIAIGISRALGFDLRENFNRPYISKTVTEFWRRWHISLSTWFRDYVYIPLGGSKKGKNRTYINLMIVFLVSGLWHGASMTFVIWGLVHGLVIVAEKKFFKKPKAYKQSIVNNTLKCFGVFVFVCFAWMFFRANSLSDAMVLIKNLFDNNYILIFTDEIYKLGLERSEFLYATISIILLLIFEQFRVKSKIVELLNSAPIVFRWGIYLLIVFTIIIFGVYGDQNTSEFIYFQF